MGIFGDRKKLTEIGKKIDAFGKKTRELKDALDGKEPNKVIVCDVCDTRNPSTNPTCYKCGHIF